MNRYGHYIRHRIIQWTDSLLALNTLRNPTNFILILTLREPQVQISAQELAILTRDFLWLFSVPSGEWRDSTLNHATAATAHILCNEFNNYPIIHHGIIGTMERVQCTEKRGLITHNE